MQSPGESVAVMGNAAETLDIAIAAYLDFFTNGKASSSSGQQVGVAAAASRLQSKQKAATANLLESLANLQSMVEVLDGQDDAVTVTAVTVLVKHLTYFHREVGAALDACSADLMQCKQKLAGLPNAQPSQPAAVQERGSVKSPVAVASSSVSSSAASTAAVAQTAVAALIGSAGEAPSDHEEVKKKKKKKTKSLTEEPPEAPLTPPPEPQALESIALVASKKGKKGKSLHAEKQPSPVVKSSEEESGKLPIRTGATFISVRAGDIMSSIADAVPGLPSEKFSSFDKILRKAVASGEYFLEDEEGRTSTSLQNLGAFFTRVWLHGVLDDLYLDLLEADDEVALPRYSSISGDISVDSDEDLKALPSAGFRQAFTDRITTYSYFGFVDDGGGGGVLAGPSLVVHDVLCQGTKKEEMLQIFTAIGGILRVQYHVYTQGKKLDKASKAMAFCLTMKSDIIAAGGVAEMSVEEGNKRVSAANKLHEPENDEEAGQESDDAQSPEDDNRFNVKAPDKTNFLQKAFKMSKKVVSAPLSIGVAAGSAVLDVAGGVVKTQTDGLFRKHFPHLAHEALVDSFSCALSKGAIVKQGFLYATANWICFVGTVLEAKLEIPLEEINKFEKANTLVFPTAIEISTFTDEKFLFTSFIARDDALKTLHRLWAESAADLR